jgi:hypothetical protein
MNTDEYYISFRSYGIMVRATNTEDAIIVAKSYAIQKGYAKPKLISVKFFDGSINYYCRVCEVKRVPIKGNICNKCTQEPDYETTKENSGKPHQPDKKP